jgi:ankyrin repeat protein
LTQEFPVRKLSHEHPAVIISRLMEHNLDAGTKQIIMKKDFTFFRGAILSIFLTLPAPLFAQEGSELITAVMYQDMDQVKSLVDAGVDINFQDPNYGSTALIVACQYNMADIGKYLIEKGADLNLPAKSGHTPLMAASTRSEELVNLLLSKGADASAALPDGTTAFTTAVTGILSENISFHVTDKLLEMGANVDESASSGPAQGYTCLMMAARNNRPDLVKYLVGKGADVNAKAGDGNTPLTLAEKENDQEMVALLKKLGAR